MFLRSSFVIHNCSSEKKYGERSRLQSGSCPASGEFSNHPLLQIKPSPLLQLRCSEFIFRLKIFKLIVIDTWVIPLWEGARHEV